MIIKQECEDFIVREIQEDNFFIEEAATYHVYELKKRNYTTQRAISHIAGALRIPSKHISFSGTKDKQAITYQYITIKGASKEKVVALDLKDVELTFLGYRSEPFYLGGLVGNSFDILIRDVSLIDTPLSFFVPNYFGEQRFSSANVAIGKAILKKKYQEAVDIILSQDKDYEEQMRAHLQKQKNDYVGALRILPRKILLFYVHAVQSFVFNQRLSEKIRELGVSKEVEYSEGILIFPQEILEQVEQEEGELIGFDSDVGYEEIEPYDFINKSLPELSLEGGKRPLFSKVENCRLQETQEGVRVQFTLGKGSYATIVLRQLFS